MTTSITNEYTSYKNIYLTLYSRKRDVSCVWEVSGDKDGLLFWPKFFLANSSTSFSSWLGGTTVGHWGPKALCLQLVLTSASWLQLTWTVWAAGYIIVLRPPASAVLPLIHTGASLDWRLGRGSIYNNHPILIFQNSTSGHFLHVPLHPPHTHILQIMLKDNNGKNIKRNYLNNSKMQKS